MIAFYRNGFSQIKIVLRANESLALIGPNAYLEDRNGVDNYINVHRIGTSQRWSVLMTESVSEEAEGSLHSIFSGWLDVDELMDGYELELEGFIRDAVGNYRDLSLVDDLKFTLFEGTANPVTIKITAAPPPMTLVGVFSTVIRVEAERSNPPLLVRVSFADSIRLLLYGHTSLSITATLKENYV